MAIRDYFNRNNFTKLFLFYVGSIILASLRLEDSEESASTAGGGVIGTSIAMFKQDLAVLVQVCLNFQVLLVSLYAVNPLGDSDRQRRHLKQKGIRTSHQVLTGAIEAMPMTEEQKLKRQYWRSQIKRSLAIQPTLLSGVSLDGTVTSVIAFCQDGREEIHMIPTEHFNDHPNSIRDVYEPALSHTMMSRSHLNALGRLFSSADLPPFSVTQNVKAFPCQAAIERQQLASPQMIEKARALASDRLNFPTLLSKNPQMRSDYGQWLKNLDDPNAKPPFFHMAFGDEDDHVFIVFMGFCPEGTEMTHFIERSALHLKGSHPKDIGFLGPHIILSRSHGTFDGKFHPFAIEQLPLYEIEVNSPHRPCFNHTTSFFGKSLNDDNKKKKVQPQVFKVR